MNKKELLFYEAYEAFYEMAGKSEAFHRFCTDAFGEDLSQDGFSDIKQINRILPYIPRIEQTHILDVGCGNGKMLGYLQKRTGARIHGFDYSENAIRTAQALFPEKSDFRVGLIGETEYPQVFFDVVISMDTLYFAPDMQKFAAQIKGWPKPDGVFFAGYQEGDVMPKTENMHTTVLAQALQANDMPYEAIDMTGETYDLLKKKRRAALRHQKEFTKEGRNLWFDMLMGQTECAEEPFECFKAKMSRYIYVARKQSSRADLQPARKR